MTGQDGDLVILGKIAGPFGVQGWVKVYSYTAPPENIVGYAPWYVGRQGAWRPVRVLQGRPHGKFVVVELENTSGRDAAMALHGLEVAVPRSELPPLPAGEYYWIELIGLRVFTVEGRDLGVVDQLLETGANDVLVVKGDRERLIPYVRGPIVKEISLQDGIIRVDWDPEF